jgi:hypothetical protein
MDKRSELEDKLRKRRKEEKTEARENADRQMSEKWNKRQE